MTAERKRALLLEARADRLAWVDGVASPFRPSGAGAGSGGTAADLLARLLGSTRAGRGSLGSAFGIAAALYGAPLSGEGGTEEGGWSGGLSRSEALERMRRQLESSLSTDEAKRLLEAAAADEDGAGGGASADPAYVAAYRTFLNREDITLGFLIINLLIMTLTILLQKAILLEKFLEEPALSLWQILTLKFLII